MGRDRACVARGLAARTPPVRVDVIIPALNEEQALPRVLAAIPRPPVRRVVVADNGSTDRTAEVARAGGAEVGGPRPDRAPATSAPPSVG